MNIQTIQIITIIFSCLVVVGYSFVIRLSRLTIFLTAIAGLFTAMNILVLAAPFSGFAALSVVLMQLENFFRPRGRQ